MKSNIRPDLASKTLINLKLDKLSGLDGNPKNSKNL